MLIQMILMMVPPHYQPSYSTFCNYHSHLSPYHLPLFIYIYLFSFSLTFFFFINTYLIKLNCVRKTHLVPQLFVNIHIIVHLNFFSFSYLYFTSFQKKKLEFDEPDIKKNMFNLKKKN